MIAVQVVDVGEVRNRVVRRASQTEALLTAAVMATLAVSLPGQQQFVEFPGRLPAASYATEVLVLGDVDRDGDLDLVCGNFAQQNRLYLNDGRGTFTDVTATQMPVDNNETLSIALGDLDGDGDLDMVVGNNAQQNRLYVNDGSGRFADMTSTSMPVDSDKSSGLQLGDVDRDGDLDVVFGNWSYVVGWQNRLYLNSGTGTFNDVTAAQMPVDNDSTYSVALGDVDGDSDLDLVCGNAFLQQNRLYLNDGTGRFFDVTSTQMPVDNDFTQAMALGDVDCDGDLDMVVGNTASLGAPSLGQQNRLYTNDGSGTFSDATARRMPTNPDATLSMALGDVDGDGDLDMVVGNVMNCCPPVGVQSLLHVNDDCRTFIDVTAARWPSVVLDSTRSLALGDLDGDGDLDVALGQRVGNGAQNRLYFNLLRQLDAPSQARIGQTYALDAYARYGVPRLVDVALPYVSSVTTRIPLPPFGTVGIDPANMVPLSPFLVPQPAGMGSATATIPNNSSLVGLSIYGQALLLQWPTAAFLTNVTSDTIQ